MPTGNREQYTITQDRRHLLKALAASGMLGLAGCPSDAEDETNEGDGSDGGDPTENGGNSDGSDGDSSGGSNGTKKVAFWHDKPDWDDGFKSSFSAIKDETSASVDVTSYGSTDSFQGALRPVFGTADGPDLFTWWVGQRLRNISDEYAVDITEQWQKHIDNGEYSESLMEQFGSDGTAYSVPYYLGYWVVWYHQKTFEDLGLSEPETWSDFEQLCDDIVAEDKIPLQVPLGDASWPTFIWFEEFLIHEDPEFYDALCKGEAKYTDDTAIWALEKMAEYQKKGYFGPADTTFQLKAPTAERQLIEGDYVMRANGDWLSGIFEGNDLDFSEMGWFILPNRYDSESKRVVIEPGPIVPHSGTGDEQMTRDIADAMLGPEFQETVNKELGFAPVNQKVDPSFLIENKANLVKTINEEDMEFSLRYWENTSPDVAVPATKAMEQLFQYPDRVEQVAKEIEKERKRVYE